MSGRLALLKLPGFGLYLIACFLSTFGTGLSYITANWLILRVQNDVMAVLVMMICFWLPSALLGPYCGVLVDRYPRQLLLIISNLIRFGALLVVAWVIFHFNLSVRVLDLLMLFMGALFALMLPSQVAFVRELVPPKDLLYANTSVDIIFEIGNVVGMSSAGFLLSVASGSLAFFINAVLFLMAAIAMCFIPTKAIREKPKERRSASSDFVLGLKYLSQDKTLSHIYTIQLLILAAVMITPVLIAPFAKNILHANAVEFGLIEAALSTGMIIGGFSVPAFVKNFGFQKTLLWLISGLVIFFVLFSFNESIVYSIILYALIGFVLASWPIIVTRAQDRTALEFQGRVQSVFSSISSMIVLVTYLVIALGAHAIPLHFLYIFPAGLGAMALYLISKLREC